MASGDQGDMEILSNQINEIVIRDDGPIQHFETVHVPEHRDITQAEALFTPSKPISNTSAGSTDISVHAKSSSDAVLFSTPQSDVKECCKDSTCSVCLSPLLCRTALVETRCKVPRISTNPRNFFPHSLTLFSFAAYLS